MNDTSKGKVYIVGLYQEESDSPVKGCLSLHLVMAPSEEYAKHKVMDLAVKENPNMQWIPGRGAIEITRAELVDLLARLDAQEQSVGLRS